MLSPEQAAATQKSNLSILFGLTDKVIEGLQNLSELNLQALRSTLAEIHEHAVKSAVAREPQQWLALQTSVPAQMAEKAQAYGRQLCEIASTTQAEFARLAYVPFQAYGYGGQTVVREAAKTPPADPQNALAAWIAASASFYETLQKTGQQTLEVARSNFDVANAAARRAVEQTHGARRNH
ncbi:MAG: hypothetical protein QOI13_2875 [Paraburkholderia sp.]|jgi:phasin family protein|nr:hypothetical protein [Paraburkholderia sp.]